ncbi:translation initiation factor eIF-2B subunit beta [Hyposmocoma kahamanoa]|uniref:translation initiation factor eIF-2B subunit beta n=1 Tax=Hyposmocoma kahamanoa TaxID=1477025 RepID=UPI000E6D9A8B|nr:translation initiation factor eIF-2B subunit beta [Hyposmocoma kahamanoa]
MSPLEDSVIELNTKHVDNIVKFVSDIRNGKLEGSNKIAVATVALLELVISDSQNANAMQLSCVVREVGRRIVRALPAELVAANMVRRVLRAIQDEYRANADQYGGGESLQKLVLGAGARRATLGPNQQDLREPLREHIAEIRLELETSAQSICGTARSHVHADELILTYGASALAERFLKTCLSRKFRLILVEGTQHQKSHAMALRLSAAGAPVTVVSNAAVCGLMSRVNKVVVGARAALAGGAALAEAGLHAVTTAAKFYSVPVIVLAPLYKLSPLYACDQHHFNALAPPHHALPYESAEACSSRVVAPQYDFVPPDHITLFITNL